MNDNTPKVRTRFWHDWTGISCTAVQVRDDTSPKVWIHTNMGWIALGGNHASNGDFEMAAKFAEEVALSFKLTEASEDYAQSML